MSLLTMIYSFLKPSIKGFINEEMPSTVCKLCFSAFKNDRLESFVSEFKLLIFGHPLIVIISNEPIKAGLSPEDFLTTIKN